MTKNIKIPRWDDSFSVGNERIDHQHHYFLNLIEYLNDTVDSGTPPLYIQHLLDELILYARFHFRSEENMMEYYKYADFQIHKELHEHLLREATSKITHFSMKKAELNDIIQFLAAWFISHTIEEDKKFHASLN